MHTLIYQQPLTPVSGLYSWPIWGLLLFEHVEGVMLLVLVHVPPHGLLLLVQDGGHLLVHVWEKQVGVRFQPLLRLLKGLHHHLAGLLPPAPLVLLAPPAVGVHVVSQAGDGMVLLVPVIHLIHRAVGWAVVTGAVVTNSGQKQRKGNYRVRENRLNWLLGVTLVVGR